MIVEDIGECFSEHNDMPSSSFYTSCSFYCWTGVRAQLVFVSRQPSKTYLTFERRFVMANTHCFNLFARSVRNLSWWFVLD